MKTLKQIGIMVIIAVLVVSGANFLNSGGTGLGAITTILGTDKLSDSRTTINDNFTDLDTTKMEMATTSVAGITTLSNLDSIGTITTGVWNGTNIIATNGGTGLTSYATGDIIFASGANTLTQLVASSTNEVLTLIGGVPVWKDAVINQANNFTWTGDHLWTAAASSSSFAITDILYVGGSATTTIQGEATATSTFSGGIETTAGIKIGFVEATATSTLNGCIGCLSGYERVVDAGQAIAASSGEYTDSVDCPAGKKIMGGGVTAPTGSSYQVNVSYPSDEDTWMATIHCSAGGACTGTVNAVALCAFP